MRSSITSTLTGVSVSRVDIEPVAAIGEPFDPRVHDAVMKVESPDVSAATVVEELQRGYMLGDRLLRAAMVKVARS
mgnify:CR=1 FL=1